MNSLDLASALAHEMGDGWTARKTVVAGPECEEITVSIKSDRVTLTGFTPDGMKGHEPHGTRPQVITVAATKTAKVIAREIERRLLPEYRVTLAATKARKAERDAADAVTAGVMQRLSDELGFRAKAEGDSRILARGPGLAKIKVRVNSEDTEVELQWIPHDLAVDIARLFAFYAEHAADSAGQR